MTVPGEFDFDDMLDEDFEIPNDPSNLDLDLDEDLIEDDFWDLGDELSIDLPNEDLGEDLKAVEEFDLIDELLLQPKEKGTEKVPSFTAYVVAYSVPDGFVQNG